MNIHKVYVIIVTYNSMRWIDKCLTSLRESATPAIPVIIDNNSKDETVEHIRTNYPEAHIIENKQNRGFGQANNQGIEWAYKQGALHFFLLNQDAYVHPDTLEKLISVQDEYNLYLVSPNHLNGIGDMLDYSYFNKIVINETNREYVSDLLLNTLKPYYPVYKINAAAWMLSRKCVEDIGGFDPIYFHYGEDGNYCQRIHYHGGQVVFVSDSYINHDRKIQGNMTVYKRQETIMQLLFAYSDVNCSFFKPTKQKAVMHAIHMREAIKFLCHLQLKNFGLILKTYIEFFLMMPAIFRSMRQNKIKTSSWLKLD